MGQTEFTGLGAPHRILGRSTEMESIARVFASGARLVSLRGTAGIGKTTLARAYASECEGTSAFCDLTEAREPSDVCGAVADLIGASPLQSEDDAVGVIAEGLAAEGPLLLVLDNFEQVVSAAHVLEVWLSTAPSLRLLVTSRERLRVPSEHCLEVGPLSVPGPDERDHRCIAASDAIALLVERGRAIRGDFELAGAELEAASSLVRHLDGIPLAIEVCAARLGVLTVSQVLERVGHGLGTLRNDHRAPLDRHATLHDAIAWSWDLLPPQAQRALAACSVFHGGFSLEAARHVLDLDDEADGDFATVGTLQELHDRSLVRVMETPEPATARRFALYESVRGFARARLEEGGGDVRERAEARHAAYYCAHGATLAKAVSTHGGTSARIELALERHNLDAIYRRGLDPGRRVPTPAVALLALAAVEPVTVGCAAMPLDLYVERLDEALAASGQGDHRERAAAGIARGSALVVRGEFDAALASYDEALAQSSKAGEAALEATARTNRDSLVAILEPDLPPSEGSEDPHHVAVRYGAQAIALMRQDRLAECQRVASEARDRFASLGDVHNEGIAGTLLAHLAIESGALDMASRECERSMACLTAPLSEHRFEGVVFMNLARIEFARGALEEAARLFRRAAELMTGMTHRWVEGLLHMHVGAFELERERWQAAETSFEGAATIFGELGDPTLYAASRAGSSVAAAQDGKVDVALGRIPSAEGPDLTPTIQALILLRGGLVDVARHRSSAGDGDGVVHERSARDALRRARALETVEGAPVLSVSHDARQAARMLERMLDGAEVVDDLTLEVGPECRWFAVRDQPRVTLSRRRALRLILEALVERHMCGDERALDTDTLFSIGWPGQVAVGTSGTNRVHVTLTRLRALGLRSLLESRDDGVRLRATANVVRVAEPGSG